jgi:hypothetical protein
MVQEEVANADVEDRIKGCFAKQVTFYLYSSALIAPALLTSASTVGWKRSKTGTLVRLDSGFVHGGKKQGGLRQKQSTGTPFCPSHLAHSVFGFENEVTLDLRLKVTESKSIVHTALSRGSTSASRTVQILEYHNNTGSTK